MKYHNVAQRILANAAIEILMLLIDLSPSMDEEDWPPSRKAGALKANRELIEAKAKQHPDDHVGLIRFWRAAEILHEPVSLRTGLSDLRHALQDPPGGFGTNFTKALELAETCLLSSPKGGKKSFSSVLASVLFETNSHEHGPQPTEALKRIVLLSDGEHNTGASPVPVAARLKKTGVVIDCIGIGGSPEDVDEELLKEIASRNSDGSIRYCFIGDHQELIQKYQHLACHIRPA